MSKEEMIKYLLSTGLWQDDNGILNKFLQILT